MPEESEVETAEDQNNENIYYQPFPKSASEEREIYADYDGCHHQYIKHNKCLSAHFN